jgi:hypothetical protein
MRELCVSSPDLMDGRGAEGETVATIHIDELGLFGTYQTALGSRGEKLMDGESYCPC